VTREGLELEPGETVLAAARASFRGGAATSMRSTFALGSARMRMRAHDAWRANAVEAGFPAAPPEMALLLTDRRILVGRPTFWGRPPKRYTGAVDLDQIHEVVAVRHGLVVGVAFALARGRIVEIEAMRGRQLRRFVERLRAQLAQHRP